MNTQTRKLITVVLLTVLLGACKSTVMGKAWDPEYLKTVPLSYFTERTTVMNQMEMREWLERSGRMRNKREIEAACIFGSIESLDRKKMGCEFVEGSPEYEANNNPLLLELLGL